MPTCRKCGKPIDFIHMRTGKYMPVEVETVYGLPEDRGRHTIITNSGRTLRVSEGQKGMPGVIAGHIPHWVKCKGAAEIKREQSRANGGAAKTGEGVSKVKRPEPQPKQISFFGGNTPWSRRT